MDQNFQPPVSSSPLPTPSDHHKIGPIVGVVIIIILLILAALYFWSQNLNKFDSTAPEGTTYSDPANGAAANTLQAEPAQPQRTAEETKVDTELGLDGLNTLDDLNF